MIRVRRLGSLCCEDQYEPLIPSFPSLRSDPFLPEETNPMPTVTIIRQSCKGVEDCGICTFVCPKHLFTMSRDMNEAGYLPPEIKDEQRCTGCKNCMIFCPDFAIVVRKREGEEGNAIG